MADYYGFSDSDADDPDPPVAPLPLPAPPVASTGDTLTATMTGRWMDQQVAATGYPSSEAGHTIFAAVHDNYIKMVEAELRGGAAQFVSARAHRPPGGVPVLDQAVVATAWRMAELHVPAGGYELVNLRRGTAPASDRPRAEPPAAVRLAAERERRREVEQRAARQRSQAAAEAAQRRRELANAQEARTKQEERRRIAANEATRPRDGPHSNSSTDPLETAEAAPLEPLSESERERAQEQFSGALDLAATNKRPGMLTQSIGTKFALESCRVLNWSGADAQLVPVLTPADGNCLAHAVALGLWGCADTGSETRAALRRVLGTDSCRRAVGPVWIEYMNRLEREEAACQEREPCKYEPADWSKEIVRLEQLARGGSGHLPSLEDVHVFVLSHMLRRPILVLGESVVYSVADGRQAARGGAEPGGTGQPLDINRMRGIYLPHRWPAVKCHKVPLVLAHHMGHFEALVASPHTLRVPQLPLVDSMLERLPVPFLLDEQVGSEFSLLDRYLNCEYSANGYLTCAYYDALQHEFAAAGPPKLPTNPFFQLSGSPMFG